MDGDIDVGGDGRPPAASFDGLHDVVSVEEEVASVLGDVALHTHPSVSTLEDHGDVVADQGSLWGKLTSFFSGSDQVPPPAQELSQVTVQPAEPMYESDDDAIGVNVSPATSTRGAWSETSPGEDAAGSSASPASESVARITPQYNTANIAASAQRWRWCLASGVLSLVISYGILIGILLLAGGDGGALFEDTSIVVDTPYPSVLVQARQGMVAADAKLCSEAGVEIMRDYGGNAVDAAVATALCLGVVHPWSSGIGGGCVALIHTAERDVTIDARETASSRAHRDMFEGREEQAQRAPDGVAVPGELKGLDLAFRKYGSGRVKWEALFTRAIEYAEELEITEQHAHVLLSVEENLRQSATLSSVYLRGDGSLKEAGEVIHRPELASTLRRIANEGVDTFYSTDEGSVGRMLLNDLYAIESPTATDYRITEADLRGYHVVERDTVETVFQSLRTIGAPPPFGSSLTLMALNLMEELERRYSVCCSSDDALTTHLIVEAMKFAFSDRSALGDPTFVEGLDDIINTIISKDHARELAEKVSMDVTYDAKHYEDVVELQGIPTDHGTTHLSCVDAHGNAVALTSTVCGVSTRYVRRRQGSGQVNLYFGSVEMGRSTGIVLNNEVDDFSMPSSPNAYGLAPSEANFIAPGKRPLSSMSPVIVVDEDNRPLLVAGASGGPRIITTTFQAVFNAMRFHHDPARAISPARLHHQLIPNYVVYEDGFPRGVLDGLRQRGHELKASNGSLAIEQMISASYNVNGSATLQGASDYRKHGQAAGF